MSLQKVKDICNNVLAIEEQAAFHGFQDYYEDAMEIAEELLESVRRAANDVTSHWKSKERQELRKNNTEEALAQND